MFLNWTFNFKLLQQKMMRIRQKAESGLWQILPFFMRDNTDHIAAARAQNCPRS
jgi:hypothetical protein